MDSMPEAKIEIKAGATEFSASGDEKWVGEQLDKFLENAPKLARISPTEPTGGGNGGGNRGGTGKPISTSSGKSLANHLKDRGATTSQVKKFLQTAVWLESKGKQRMTTRDVTNALKDAHQSRLGNPADCLNQNVTKGYCEKDGKEFFVTEEGRNQG
jgi:hypothetical protein